MEINKNLTIEELNKNIRQVDLVGKRIKLLFVKKKKLLGSYHAMIDFKENIIFLERNNGKVEFLEGHKANKFKFVHSDGNSKTIFLNPLKLKVFYYGKNVFKGYYLHEDYVTPMPVQPLVDAEIITDNFSKTLMDQEKYKVKQTNANAKMYWNILMGIAIVMGVYMYGGTLVNAMFGTSIGVGEVAKTTSEVIAKNVTNAFNMTSTTIMK